MSVKSYCLVQPHGLACKILLQLQAELAGTHPKFPTEAADLHEAADNDAQPLLGDSSTGDLQTELAQVLQRDRAISDASDASHLHVKFRCLPGPKHMLTCLHDCTLNKQPPILHDLELHLVLQGKMQLT